MTLYWCSICNNFGLPSTWIYTDFEGMRDKGLCTDCANSLRGNMGCKTDGTWQIWACEKGTPRINEFPPEQRRKDVAADFMKEEENQRR